MRPQPQHAGNGGQNGGNISFEEARRRGIFQTCRQKWQRGHRCESGVVRQEVRRRVSKGESAIHIISDLVQSLESLDPSDEDATYPADTHAIEAAVQELEDRLGTCDRNTKSDENDANMTGHIMSHFSAPGTSAPTPVNWMDMGATGATFGTGFTNVETNLMSITYSMSPSHLDNTR